MYVGRLRDEFAAADGASLRQFERSPVQLALLDAAGEIVFVNASFKAWLAAVAGRHDSDGNLLQVMASLLCRSSARAASGRWSAFLSGSVDSISATVELPCHGAAQWFRISGIRFKSGGDAQMLFVSEDVTSAYEAELAARDLRSRLLASRESERQLISEELHDSTVQHLVGGGPQSHAAQGTFEGRCGRAGDPQRHRAVGRQRDAGAARLHLPAASARSRERRIGADFAPLLRGLRAPYRPCCPLRQRRQHRPAHAASAEGDPAHRAGGADQRASARRGDAGGRALPGTWQSPAHRRLGQWAGEQQSRACASACRRGPGQHAHAAGAVRRRPDDQLGAARHGGALRSASAGDLQGAACMRRSVRRWRGVGASRLRRDTRTDPVRASLCGSMEIAALE